MVAGNFWDLSMQDPCHGLDASVESFTPHSHLDPGLSGPRYFDYFVFYSIDPFFCNGAGGTLVMVRCLSLELYIFTNWTVYLEGLFGPGRGCTPCFHVKPVRHCSVHKHMHVQQGCIETGIFI
jgi:hypothetical protein